MKVSYILDRYISWPLKRQLQPSMYFKGIAYEIPMKAQLKTHESVQLTVAQKWTSMRYRNVAHIYFFSTQNALDSIDSSCDLPRKIEGPLLELPIHCP